MLFRSQNNQMQKALIKHFRVHMQVYPGSENEWSDLDSEGDVFAPGEGEEVESDPVENEGDDPSF